MDRALEDLELKISRFLRAGVVVAGLFLTLGWLSSVVRGGSSLGRLTQYDHVSLARDLGEAMTRGDWPRMVSYLGLVILVALPFTRVVLTAVLFKRRREWVLAGAAAFVSLALLASVALGIDL